MTATISAASRTVVEARKGIVVLRARGAAARYATGSSTLRLCAGGSAGGIVHPAGESDF